MGGSMFDWAFRAVVLLALLGVGLMLHQSRGDVAGPEATRQLLDRMEHLERRMAEFGTSSPSAMPFGVAAPASPGSPRFADSPGGTRPLASEQAEKYDEQKRRDLQRSFAAEGPAPASDSIPQQVIAAFGSDAVVQAVDIPQSQNVNCRAGTCLIRATFKQGQDSSDWATRVMLELGPALSSYTTAYTLQPDGSHELNLYAVRNRK